MCEFKNSKIFLKFNSHDIHILKIRHASFCYNFFVALATEISAPAWSAIALTYDIRLELAPVDRIVAEIFLFVHFIWKLFFILKIKKYFKKLFAQSYAQFCF